MPIIRDTVLTTKTSISVVCDKCGIKRELGEVYPDSPDYAYGAPTGWTKVLIKVTPEHGLRYDKAFFFCQDHVEPLLVPA